VFSQNPADLYNAYQFKNVEVESGDPFDSVEYGKLTKYITEWDSYIQLASCSDCNKGIPVEPSATTTPTQETIATPTQESIPVETPTNTPIPINVSLVVTNFEADPGNPVLNQRFLLRLTVENRGDPIPDPTWDYNGRVSLKDANGSEIEAYEFSRDRFSYINQATENGQPTVNKWVISIPVSFVHEVENGRLSVTLQPEIYPISPGMVEAMVTLKPARTDMKSCALAVAEKTGGVFTDDATLKTAWESETASVVAANCAEDDVACYATPLAKGLVKTMQLSYPDIPQNAWSSHAPLMSRLLVSLAGIFDVNVLQVCPQPTQWLWKTVDALNSQGLDINLVNVSSSVVMRISNANGEISGVLLNGEMVQQMAETQVIQWNHEVYILYSPQDVLITAQGVTDGTFNLQGILGKGGERASIAYENVAINDGALAVINTADSSGAMQLDSNGDGQVDATVPMSRAAVISQMISQPETASKEEPSTTKTPFRLPCASVPAMVLPVAGLWFLHRRKIKDYLR
jgi:hypothetical protein